MTAECELVCDEWVVKDAPGTVRKCYGELLIKIAKEQQKKEFAMPLQSGIYATYGVMKLRVLQLSSKAPKFAGTVLLGIFILWLILFSGLIYFHQIDISASALPMPQKSLQSSLQSRDVVERNTQENEESLLGYIAGTLPNQMDSEQMLQPPLNTSKVFSWENKKREHFLYSSYLYFIVEEGNKSILAGCDGVITEVQAKDIEDMNEEEFLIRRLGKYVVLDCGNGLSVRYTFLDSVAVEPGQHVSAGDVLGIAGHTGASYGDTDQGGVYVMQDGLMVDPLLFFDIDVPIQEIS